LTRFSADRFRFGLLLLAAPWLSVQPAWAAAPADRDCKSRVAAFAREQAAPGRRLVFTFTGTQEAVQPLWEAASGPHTEEAFFPIDLKTFVLTITVHIERVETAFADQWAAQLCGYAGGARYNGAVAYSGNDMVNADMSRPAAAR
jgi:hypothetical protein